MKLYYMDTVYAASDPGILSVNDYTGQMEKVKKLTAVTINCPVKESRRNKAKYLRFPACNIPLPRSGITFLNALHSGLSVMQGYFAPGISYLSDDWHYDIREEFPKSFSSVLFSCGAAMISIF